MDMIQEMNAFTDWLETNPLDSTTQILWVHIILIANKSGSPEWFTVANPTLMAKAGISEKSLIKHRNFLVQKGRINYKNQGKRQAGKYQIISLSVNNTVNKEVKREVMKGVEGGVNPPALLKDLKDTTTTSTSDDYSELTVNDVYTKVFGDFFMSPLMSEYVKKLLDSGCTEYFVKELMFEVGQSGSKPSLRYMQTIGDRWIKEGIASREEARMKNPKNSKVSPLKSQSEKARQMREASRRLKDEEARNV